MTTRRQIHLNKEIGIEGFKILENSSGLLSKFGLSPNQSRVYLSLSKNGPTTGSALSKSLGIPRTEVYHILKILKQKDCVYKINQKPMKFGPVSVEIFFEKKINLEKNKIHQLEETLLTLKKFKSNASFGEFMEKKHAYKIQ